MVRGGPDLALSGGPGQRAGAHLRHPDTVTTEIVGPDTYRAAATKAGLVWLQGGRGPARPLWIIWHDDALHTVVGGAEQPDPFDALPHPVEVTVPSKDTRAGLLRVRMTADLVPPGTARWVAATDDLRMSRLNIPFEQDLPEVWATDSRVVRLEPAGPVRIADGRDNTPVEVDGATVRKRGWRRMRGHLRSRRRASGAGSNLAT